MQSVQWKGCKKSVGCGGGAAAPTCGYCVQPRSVDVESLHVCYIYIYIYIQNRIVRKPKIPGFLPLAALVRGQEDFPQLVVSETNLVLKAGPNSSIWVDTVLG